MPDDFQVDITVSMVAFNAVSKVLDIPVFFHGNDKVTNFYPPAWIKISHFGMTAFIYMNTLSCRSGNMASALFMHNKISCLSYLKYSTKKNL